MDIEQCLNSPETVLTYLTTNTTTLKNENTAKWSHYKTTENQFNFNSKAKSAVMGSTEGNIRNFKILIFPRLR